MENKPMIMITGSGGFMGRHMASALEAACFPYIALSHRELDVTDASAVEKALSEYRPAFLVHTAAISSTAYAAAHPEESLALNVMAPLSLASACGRYGTRLYAMSSDQVYGGCALGGPLPETALLATNNVYGQHKLLMEEKVLAVAPDSVVLRLSWMFERYNAPAPHPDIISRLITAEGCIKASTKEFRGMTDVDAVCSNIIMSFGLLPGGVYNFGAGNLLTSYDTLRSVAPLAGLPADRIVPDGTWGRNLSMDCSKLNSFGLFFRDTVEGIACALNA